MKQIKKYLIDASDPAREIYNNLINRFFIFALGIFERSLLKLENHSNQDKI